ncbi:NAD-dependent epimerase/dehydratase family protein [Parasedimentitalea marina]|uniref:NAD-dependent epimerase/dehydratase family protein n=1 Tax=Parasedimentitalea marina TaxID=2483033 RepID=UPI001EE9982F|nr:NAD-dependent epimerase/dehydratase family protein [Parasedimentitalea marina]
MAKISKPLKRHHDVEQKRGVPDLSLMSETQQQFFDQILGPEFIAFLEQLTGISPLYPDPDLVGGGLHEIYTGGFLNTHADFNFHPKTGKHRCLNLILYLNADWQEDWHGQLELWSENLDGEPVRVAPTLNTAALFRTTETSWHGHPKPLACPEHVSRRSLAVYYYTDWPEGLEQRAKTTYVLTPDQQQDLRQDLLAGWDQIADADAACRLARRYQPAMCARPTRRCWPKRRRRPGPLPPLTQTNPGRIIRMTRILVTGGAGFIGSHLVPALLAQGHELRILDSLSPQIHGAVPEGTGWLNATPGLEFQRGSVTVREDLARAIDGIEAIVHLASETGTGQSMYEISRYAQENVQGTAELMQVLATTPGHAVQRVLLASSRSVYGEGAYLRASDGQRLTPAARSAAALKSHQWDPTCPDSGEVLQLVATREEDRTAPSSIYAATKLMQEDLLRITCDSTGIGYGILRLQNVYGEGQSLKNPYTGILSIFSTKIRRGLELPIFEDGLESRDFVHVSDVAAAFAAALARPRRPIR